MCDISSCGGYTVLTRGGGNVATAVENTVDGVCGSKTHDGGVGISTLGSVGDESEEDYIEICVEYCAVRFVGFVVWTVNIIVIWRC